MRDTLTNSGMANNLLQTSHQEIHKQTRSSNKPSCVGTSRMALTPHQTTHLGVCMRRSIHPYACSCRGRQCAGQLQANPTRHRKCWFSYNNHLCTHSQSGEYVYCSSLAQGTVHSMPRSASVSRYKLLRAFAKADRCRVSHHATHSLEPQTQPSRLMYGPRARV